MPKITAGQTYRLRRDFEVRDEKTGTMKHFLPKGTALTVRRIAADEDRVWLEGVPLPVAISALERAVE